MQILTIMEFKCVEDCSQCCIEREYFPEKKFGKIGVLLLPEEKRRIQLLANKNNLDILILPRIGTSQEKDPESIEILAFQMMGIEKNGNTCPFLDTKTGKKSPHGGFPCTIYQERPLACSTYPLVESSPIILDQKCKFCKEHATADGNLNSEIESLAKIKAQMKTNARFIWRYATGIGEEDDKSQLKKGWFLEE